MYEDVSCTIFKYRMHQADRCSKIAEKRTKLITPCPSHPLSASKHVLFCSKKRCKSEQFNPFNFLLFCHELNCQDQMESIRAISPPRPKFRDPPTCPPAGEVPHGDAGLPAPVRPRWLHGFAGRVRLKGSLEGLVLGCIEADFCK